jgi:hypothetical protein
VYPIDICRPLPRLVVLKGHASDDASPVRPWAITLLDTSCQVAPITHIRQVSNGIGWLDELQAFYRERSVIEREYGQRLAGLAKKYFEKKAKKSSSLSVGDTPTLTPGSLER